MKILKKKLFSHPIITSFFFFSTFWYEINIILFIDYLKIVEVWAEIGNKCRRIIDEIEHIVPCNRVDGNKKNCRWEWKMVEKLEMKLWWSYSIVVMTSLYFPPQLIVIKTTLLLNPSTNQSFSFLSKLWGQESSHFNLYIYNSFHKFYFIIFSIIFMFFYKYFEDVI